MGDLTLFCRLIHEINMYRSVLGGCLGAGSPPAKLSPQIFIRQVPTRPKTHLSNAEYLPIRRHLPAIAPPACLPPRYQPTRPRYLLYHIQVGEWGWAQSCITRRTAVVLVNGRHRPSTNRKCTRPEVPSWCLGRSAQSIYASVFGVFPLLDRWKTCTENPPSLRATSLR